ncbi:MAG: uroporphyrinogen decarboxylase [Candidatus Eutrophobiaceae bacterium]
MARMKNDRLIRALLRQPVEVTPVWIMRQAGRYLPEYRRSRERANNDFLALCKTPKWACEVTLQPIERYPLDAAILFSDILTIPDAMGLELSFVEGTGPIFAKPIRSAEQIKRLNIPDPKTDLSYVLEAVQLVQRELDGRVPLIGFSGSPWTLAAYMVEGGGSRDFRLVKSLMYSDPKSMHTLLHKLARAVAAYLNAQIEAGVNVVMVFDSWGGILSEPAWEEFSFQYIKQIFANLHREYAGRRIPRIVFSKGTGLWVNRLAECGCDALGLDWHQDLGATRALVGDRLALQGNMDPAVLYASERTIRTEAARILASYGHGSGHVFNLGHGVQQYTDPEKLGTLIDAVHELSKPYHAAH